MGSPEMLVAFFAIVRMKPTQRGAEPGAGKSQASFDISGHPDPFVHEASATSELSSYTSL